MVAKANEPDERRVIVPMRRELVARIDDFRWGRRLPSRAEAIRRLIEAGLEAPGPADPGKRRS